MIEQITFFQEMINQNILIQLERISLTSNNKIIWIKLSYYGQPIQKDFVLKIQIYMEQQKNYLKQLNQVIQKLVLQQFLHVQQYLKDVHLLMVHHKIQLYQESLNQLKRQESLLLVMISKQDKQNSRHVQLNIQLELVSNQRLSYHTIIWVTMMERIYHKNHVSRVKKEARKHVLMIFQNQTKHSTQLKRNLTLIIPSSSSIVQKQEIARRLWMNTLLKSSQEEDKHLQYTMFVKIHCLLLH